MFFVRPIDKFTCIFSCESDRVIHCFCKKRYCFDKKWHAIQTSDNGRGRGSNKRELVSTNKQQYTVKFWFGCKIKFSNNGHPLSVCLFFLVIPLTQWFCCCLLCQRFNSSAYIIVQYFLLIGAVVKKYLFTKIHSLLLILLIFNIILFFHV